MGAMRALLLAASHNHWLKERARRYAFVRKSVSRFMPGEALEDAIHAAHTLQEHHISTAFTHLGENIGEAREADEVASHYLSVLGAIEAERLDTEISVKPTQLGLDLSESLCERNLRRLLEQVSPSRTVWIDMESSPYVDATLRLYHSVLKDHPNCGVCLQAYLFRTNNDVEDLLSQRPTIRLVKGAYSEAESVAAQKKPLIDERYFALAQKLVSEQIQGNVRRVILATHDPRLIEKIKGFAAECGIKREQIEVQMLYGIQRELQQSLAADGWRSSVLIAYGTHWYAWFLRRLAERPANLWLVWKNLAAG